MMLCSQGGGTAPKDRHLLKSSHRKVLHSGFLMKGARISSGPGADLVLIFCNALSTSSRVNGSLRNEASMLGDEIDSEWLAEAGLELLSKSSKCLFHVWSTSSWSTTLVPFLFKTCLGSLCDLFLSD